MATIAATSSENTTTDTKIVIGSILAVTDVGHGEYTVKEVEGQARIPDLPLTPSPQFRIPFEWSFPPGVPVIKVKGYIDTSAKQITVQISVLGKTLGTYTGSFDDGIKVSFNNFLASGYIRFYIKTVDGKRELWVQGDIKVPFKEFKFDEKIFTLP